MTTDEVKMEILEKIGLLNCLLAIIDKMREVEQTTAAYMAGWFLCLVVTRDEPGLWMSIKRLADDLLEDPELDKGKLVALRHLVEAALTDAEEENKKLENG